MVNVNPVNDSPTLNTIANLNINEDSGLQTVNLTGIGTGAANENQSLLITANSSNPSLIPNPNVSYSSPDAVGTLTFTPAPEGFGTASITVTVNDGGALNNLVTRTFTVTVAAVNDLPTLDAIGNLSIAEDSGVQSVNLTGITAGADRKP